MAIRNAVVEAPPEDVWAVLADGWAYQEWVVGTQRIRSVDPSWPAAGATIEFTAGVGPLTVEDTTVVRISEPPDRLELEAHADPLGTARVAIRLIRWGEGCLIVLDEHPLRGPGLRGHFWLTEAVLSLRHRRMLRNLVALVERRAGGAVTGGQDRV